MAELRCRSLTNDLGSRMGFAFSRSETVTQGVRRIADEQLTLAMGELRDVELSHERAIHQTRKRLKMIRGLLRLVRSGMVSVAKKENRFLRDIAGSLSALRDADIMRQASQTLRERSGARIGRDAFEAVCGIIDAVRNESLRKGTDPEQLRLQTVERLEERRGSVRKWSVAENDGDVLFEGLRENFQKGAKRLAVAWETRSDEDLHEWRKCCKDHWYHVRLMKKVWPEEFTRRARILSNLCDDLGQDHDLAELWRAVQSDENALPPECRAAWERELQGWRNELQSQAFDVGRRIYAESPRCLARRVEAYWRLWRDAAAER